MSKYLNVLCIASLVVLLFAKTVHGQALFSLPTYAGSGQPFEADFNGDGKPDLLSSDGTLQLGNGDGTFKTGTSVAGTPLVVADFNGDGKPDLLELGTGTLLVLLGNGDGTFQAPISTNSGAGLTVVAAADLTGNGKADVVGVFNNSLFVYLSKGDGTFTAGVAYSLGAVQIYTPLIMFGDFNGDHKADVAVVASGQEIVLLGNGDGTFQSTPLTSTGSAVALGDFNGDGKLDLVNYERGDSDQVTVFIQLGNGDGTFQAATPAFTAPYHGIGSDGYEHTALAAADLNGDGKSDLVLAADVIGIYLSNGDGTFSPNYYQPMVSGKAGIAIADFNSDGKPDVAVDGEVLLGKGNGTFQGPPTVLTPGFAPIAVVGHFVNKGAPGVAAVPFNPGYSNTLYIWSNDGTGLLSLAHTYALPQAAYAIATADVNGDGNLDLVVEGNDPVSQNWSYIVLLGNGDGSFQTPVLHQQSGQMTGLGSIVIADFNNDHKLDLALAQGNQTFAVLLGNGDGTFGTPTYVFDGDGGSIVSADFNSDGNLDVAEEGPSGLAIVLGNGNGTFQPAAFPYTSPLFGLVAGDLNDDGKVDLLGTTGVGIQVLLSNGNGTFNALPPFDFPLGQAKLAVALADVNGDGKLDVITTDAFGSARTNGVFLGRRDGTFDPSEFRVPYWYPPHTDDPGLQVADMNGDGKPDLIIEHPVSNIFVLLNSTASAFALSATALSPGTITAGSSARSTVTVTPTVGFNGTVTLSCTRLPVGASCNFNPASVTTGNNTVSSSLTVNTVASTPAGTYPITVTGTSAAMANIATVTLIVASGPDFSVAPTPGSQTSQTIHAGQQATFSLDLTGVGGFSGTVILGCNVSPVVTSPPTCSLSSDSVQVSGSPQSVTVTVSTGVPMKMGTVAHIGFPPTAMPLACTAMLLAWGALLLLNRKGLPRLAAPLVVLAVASWIACGGGGSSSHTTPGAVTYTATVTATSGGLSHTMPLTVTVQ